MRLLHATIALYWLFFASLAFVPVVLAVRLVGAVASRHWRLRRLAGLQTLWGRLATQAMGIRLDVADEPPPGRYVIVANHVSYVDIAVLSALFPGRFVAKSEIAGWPLVGFFTRLSGTLFVDQKKRRDVLRVGREMEETLNAGVRVIVFPEGGASRGERVERLHSSLLEPAVRTGIPCRAVALSYETPGDRWAPAATVCWWGGMGFWRHFLRLLALKGIRARVRWAPEPFLAEDRKILALRLHQALEEAFTPIRQTPVPPDFPWPEVFEARAPGSGR